MTWGFLAARSGWFVETVIPPAALVAVSNLVEMKLVSL
jgi:hypothetical protein